MAVWTGVVACCCQPRVLGAFSSASVSAGLGRFPCASSTQTGGVQPCSWSACAAPAAAWMLGIAVRFGQHTGGVGFGALVVNDILRKFRTLP